MRKYIIKNADGSEQTVMRAVYESCEEAGASMMNYIRYHNENCDADNYLSPFDFILEEVYVKDVNETVTDFNSARKALGLKPNVAYIPKSGDVKRLVTDINPMHIEALIAINKLFTIAEAWNNEDGFVPNFSDMGQDRWFPLFKHKKDATGLVFAYSCNAWSCLLTDEHVVIVGSRLCFKSSERTAQFGKQFVDLYNKVFL